MLAVTRSDCILRTRFRVLGFKSPYISPRNVSVPIKDTLKPKFHMTLQHFSALNNVTLR